MWDLGAGLGKQQRLVLPPPLNKVGGGTSRREVVPVGTHPGNARHCTPSSYRHTSTPTFAGHRHGIRARGPDPGDMGI
eukprot:364613-Chlamydomonas_euryale.AAC.8